MSHTPGPWTVDPRDYEYVTAGDFCVAAVWMRDVEDRTAKDERDANARLIAAAPDLLEALQRLSDFADEWHPLNNHVKHAREVIAKATQP